MTDFIIIHDMKDPDDPQGRTYREVNLARQHAIPLGSLVELETGERLRVMKHTRDCDGTPLYSLGVKEEADWTWIHGYSDDIIKVV